MIRPRSKPRRGEPTDAEKEALRELVYAETGGICELRIAPDCIRGVLPLNGPNHFSHWHLVHKKAKRVHGWHRSNLCGGCWKCHAWVHGGGKPCPRKVVAA